MLGAIGERYFDVDVGQRLRETRIAAGYTQSQLATLIGVSSQQVQKYESGSNRLPAKCYSVLAGAVGFDVTDLLLGQQDSAERFYTSQREREVVLMFRSIPDQKRQLFLDFMRDFVVGGPKRAADKTTDAQG